MYNLVCFGTYQKRAQNQGIIGGPKNSHFWDFFETFYDFIKLLTKNFIKSGQSRQTGLFLYPPKRGQKQRSSWSPENGHFL
jgi:hypothetical protein